MFCLSNRKITKMPVGTREWVSGDKPDHTGFQWDVEDLWIGTVRAVMCYQWGLSDYPSRGLESNRAV